MSGPWITTCLHGIDLRFTPRCYICKPEGRWVDLDNPKTAEALARVRGEQEYGAYWPERDDAWAAAILAAMLEAAP